VARPLTVTEVRRRDVRPRVIAYGLARPARRWRAIARVDGEVVETHPQLDAGHVVRQGTPLLRIEATDYELQVERLSAETDNLKAQLRELERTETNEYELLKVEQESLRLAEAEVERLRGLRGRGAASQSELDRARRERLTAKRQVQTLQNSLRLIPVRRQQLQASLRAADQRLRLARRDLDRTVIRAPLDGRLATVAIESGQYVQPNQELFELHGIDHAEVEARVPLDDLAFLLPTDSALADRQSGRGGDRPQPVAPAEASSPQSPGTSPSSSLAEAVIGTAAVVRVHSGPRVYQTRGRVVRVREQVDRRTRTFGVVVSVPTGATRPPLLEDTFCEVELTGAKRSDRLVVPASAVRKDSVYVVDADNRLARRRVRKGATVEGGVVVTGELEAGARVVVSDPAPAVIGALIEPVPVEAEWGQ